MDLEDAFRAQAAACGRLGSPMYADLLARVADALGAGGAEAEPFARVLAGHEDAPGPSGLALRLAGSVHRLVLERRAGALAAYYPSVGGTWEPEGGWAAFTALVADEPEAVREWLDRPPQTNEVGRSAALTAGLLELGRETALPVRLVEIGSSGGLNLLADRFRYVDDTGRGHGDEASPVRLEGAWTGPGPWTDPDATWPSVVERTGTDVMPVDVATTAGRLTLTAYVWPDQTDRHERLRGALELAAETPPTVRRQTAREVADGLSLVDGTVTVLWHSVMWQYLDRSEQDDVLARVEELGASATEGRSFAHLSLEPRRRTPEEDHQFWLVLRRWPGGEPRFLARSRGHGVPVDWPSGP
ncbi:DUF2332 domain-containing protein [Nocardioides sp.]|uniref:DUF2332 domain-containing protein n=1 Tax=Nocardioides sp. TaxID=35761 RepID=UPI0027227F34|nr:DUF2332 domain-containing protein [Nocardioides sp.]MDO9458294.1 DUF2332 domain-containing protein [Nocardioides sp.]